jgi:hypothetical protein
MLYQHTPSSEFSIRIEDFPYLLLTALSDKSHRGCVHRMLLQASCLVHLGNALLTDKSSVFFVKAICVDRHDHAVEYTLYQRGSKPGDDKVITLLSVAWQEKLTPVVGRIFTEVLRFFRQT